MNVSVLVNYRVYSVGNVMNVIFLLFAPFILLLTLIKAIFSAGVQQAPKRIILFFAVFVGHILLNVIHVIGFFGDAILFRKAKTVAIVAPIFVLGIPRSGTTFLQRVLSEDTSLTTLRAWECLLAPTICERYFWLAMTKACAPFFGAAERVQQKIFGKLDGIHTIRLDEPEEDFLLLLAIHACFLAFVLAPNDKYLWQLARFDEALPTWWRKAVMRYYRTCLQKHLYFHGQDKKILSKNPSFTPMMQSLQETFPDARFIACTRAPHEALASQFSSLKPSFALVSNAQSVLLIKPQMLRTLAFYYRRIAQWGEQENCLIVPMNDIKSDLLHTTEVIYQFCELPLTADFRQRLTAQNESSRQYKSRHDYQLSEFNISDNELDQSFIPAWNQHKALSLQGASI